MVSLIIVEYNSMKRTLEYIDSFINNIKSNEEINIIIVDNTQDIENFEILMNQGFDKINTVDIEDKIKKPIEIIQGYLYRGHKIIAIKSKENLGYAKGNNLGAEISQVLFEDEYYIFSNNDLKFVSEIDLETLLNPFKDNDIAVVGPRIVGLDGKNQNPRKNNSIWKQVVLYHLNILLFNTIYKYINNIDYDNRSKKADWLMGCFLIIDSNKFNEVGLFDENTFLFAEEMILADKLLKKNYICYFLNEVTLIHSHGQTVKNTMNIIKSMEISYKSNEYYFKEYKKVSKFSLFVAMCMFNLFKILFPIREKIKGVILKFIKQKALQNNKKGKTHV